MKNLYLEKSKKEFTALFANKENVLPYLANDLETMAKIHTLATIKWLVSHRTKGGKWIYSPYLDHLRRTIGNNNHADNYTIASDNELNITADIKSIKSEIKDNRKLLKQYDKDLKTLYDSTNNLDEIENILNAQDEITNNLDELSTDLEILENDLRNIKLYNPNTYTDLQDMSQEFIKGYLDTINYQPTDKQVDRAKEQSTTINVITSVNGYFDFMTPCDAQHHFERVACGRNAVTRYIRHQSTRTNDFSSKMTSVELLDENGNFEKYVHTQNMACQSQGDIERLKAIITKYNLNAREQRFINIFLSKGAIKAEKVGREIYFNKNVDKINGKMTLFQTRLDKAGYKARLKFTLEKIGILTPSAQSNFIKRLENKCKGE